MNPLPQPLLSALTDFLSRHPPRRLNQNLRNMLLEWLQQDGALEAENLKDLLFDLEGLFLLLDEMERYEVRGTRYELRLGQDDAKVDADA